MDLALIIGFMEDGRRGQVFSIFLPTISLASGKKKMNTFFLVQSKIPNFPMTARARPEQDLASGPAAEMPLEDRGLYEQSCMAY